MKRNLNAVLETAVDAAQEAGRFIRSVRAKGDVVVQYKGVRDLLTEADLGAEKIILERIRAQFPDDAILSEEASPSVLLESCNAPGLWIIDPVDGTTNFALGHHQVGVSIAFASGGELYVGVVFAPFLNELFTAVKGGGARLNGSPIYVSAETTLDRSLIGTGFPYDRTNVSTLVRRVERVLKTCRDIRRYGAASLDLCFVACGRLDGFYESLQCWDMAAGALIVREAGGRCGHIYPREKAHPIPPELDGENLLATCPAIFELLREQVAV